MNNDSDFSLTPAAWTLLAVAVGTFVVGWMLGWFEFFAVAAGCGLLILLAVPFVLGRTDLALNRALQPRRVVVGEPAVAEMVTINRSRRRSRSQVVTEQVGEQTFVLDVPALAPSKAASFDYPLPTDRRGQISIGPSVISRSDPLGLLLRRVGECAPETLWVHPKTLAVSSIPSGLAKDLEGPTFDTSPAGDVAFHTIREYQLGDDPRHVHWMSTARTGELMVRHYVDNRRPHVSVLVDALDSVMTPEEFEVAVEIAASLGVSAVHEGRAVAVQIGPDVLVGHNHPATYDDVLDRAAAVTQHEEFSLRESAAQMLRTERGASVIVLVVGRCDIDVLSDLCAELRRAGRIIVVPVYEGGDDLAVPRAQTIPGPTLDGFVAHWGAYAA